jgi:hypothetical protein
MLSCPACAERRSVAAMRQYQKHPLLLVAQNHGAFTTRVISSGGNGPVKHVQMFAAGNARTFCGEIIESHHRRGTQSFDSYNDATNYICSACRSVIAEILTGAACTA